MAPKDSRKGMGKATARAKMMTSVPNWRLSFGQNRTKGVMSDQIRVPLSELRCLQCHWWEAVEPLLWYNLCWSSHDSAHCTISADVAAPHEQEFGFLEVVGSLRLRYAANVYKDRDQRNDWGSDNPRAFGDEVDFSNPQITSLAKVTRTGQRFSWYGSDDLRVKIEPPSCRQYKPGDILAVKPKNLDEIIDEVDDD